MNTIWMVRSNGGESLEEFEAGYVGVGFGIHEDLTGKSKETLIEIKSQSLPNASRQEIATPVGMLYRFANDISEGDHIITYDAGARCYWPGIFVGGYYPELSDRENPHRRKVNWINRSIFRDSLKVATKNSLGSPLTLFKLPEDAAQDMLRVSQGQTQAPDPTEPTAEDEVTEFADRDNLIQEAREKLKDRIVLLDDRQMEELLAAVLRAMGYRTTVSPIGADRGVDVMASPDGLGLQEPRIKAEVKHRKGTKMGSQDIRSFIGALRKGDRGIYLSTVGFSKDARYEGDRSELPITLLDLDGLARLIETYYSSFDTEGKLLLPLTTVLWPIE